MVGRGEVRWLELEEEGRRPVVVLTRDVAMPGLRNVVVALITRTTRGIETEVELGPEDGMRIRASRRDAGCRISSRTAPLVARTPGSTSASISV